MTVQETIQMLESHGWRRVKSDEHLCQFRHDSKPGIVTLTGRPEMEMPPGVSRSLLRFAQVEEGG